MRHQDPLGSIRDGTRIVRKDNQFFDTMRWVLLGCIVGGLIYLAHVLISHDPEDEIDNHAKIYEENE